MSVYIYIYVYNYIYADIFGYIYSYIYIYILFAYHTYANVIYLWNLCRLNVQKHWLDNQTSQQNDLTRYLRHRCL